jgi:electron transfer flavoprotein beta subunit
MIWITSKRSVCGTIAAGFDQLGPGREDHHHGLFVDDERGHEMKIVVLMKEVPDTWGDRALNLETGLLDRAAGDPVLDEINERALEVALTHRDSHPDTEVVLLAVGPATVPNSLRKGLAMGADRAVHVQDDALLGADMSLTAEVLAAAIRSIGFDLVIAGNLSTDGGGGAIPSMVAEMLGVAGISSLSTVEITDSAVAGRRNIESGGFDVSANLPAVISITEALPDARFSNFKGIMAAKKKPFETLSLADLGASVTEDDSRSIVIAVAQRPARSAGIRIEDDGDAGRQIADFLFQNQLIKGRSA